VRRVSKQCEFNRPQSKSGTNPQVHEAGAATCRLNPFPDLRLAGHSYLSCEKLTDRGELSELRPRAPEPLIVVDS
jgi:hypothetical protein